MFLIVGLGNPGRSYARTRHNVGFMVVDALAKELNVAWKKKMLAQAEIGEGVCDGTRVVLVKPTTFMNASGNAVARIAKKLSILPQNILVIHDDASLAFGKIRVRAGGSAGGHNGAKSMIERLGTDVFSRIKVGIGSPPSSVPLENYVLQSFAPDETKILPDIIKKTATIVTDAIANGLKETTVV